MKNPCSLSHSVHQLIEDTQCMFTGRNLRCSQGKARTGRKVSGSPRKVPGSERCVKTGSNQPAEKGNSVQSLMLENVS